ncbi:MAG: hypothetical protein A4E53_01874 [Pelotomaculum sp. PtaB.Bin104]|nr:MAG: hypothetical protein A4E53_01874 [Pelotomaculum sp. PtaB.Bin104]
MKIGMVSINRNGTTIRIQTSTLVGVVMKQFAKRFYKSKAWQDCRDAFFKSRFGLCEQRGAREVGFGDKTKPVRFACTGKEIMVIIRKKVFSRSPLILQLQLA